MYCRIPCIMLRCSYVVILFLITLFYCWYSVFIYFIIIFVKPQMNKGAFALSIQVERKKLTNSPREFHSQREIGYRQPQSSHGICNPTSNELGGNKMADELSYPTRIEMLINRYVHTGDKLFKILYY